MNDCIMVKRIVVYIFLLIFTTFSIIVFFIDNQATDNKIRSSDLTEQVFKQGNNERTVYVNTSGSIEYAADKHYASKVRVFSDNSIMEEYYDVAGNPVRQSLGHFKVLYEYDEFGNNVRQIYLDKNNSPMIINLGYAIIERTFYNDGRVDCETYFGADGNAVNSKAYGYGRLKGYDQNGRNTIITYLDFDGSPMKTQLGYAVLHRTFYEDGPFIGKVDNEFYYDANGQPIALSHGAFGLHREYDEYGRVDVLTYLDPVGKPIKTKQGYTTIKRTFYPDDTIKTEMYYDADGIAVCLSQGQYGLKRINGETVFINSEGEEIFNLNNYLRMHPLLIVTFGIIVTVFSTINKSRGNVALLCFYVCFVGYMTLMYRVGTGTGLEMNIFWSYKQFFQNDTIRIEILSNIWLFVPYGAILFRLKPRIWIALIFSFFTSAIVEIAQYYYGLGLCEIDDIMSNCVGGVIGIMFYSSFNSLCNTISNKNGLITAMN